jgi:hypothetical protein
MWRTHPNFQIQEKDSWALVVTPVILATQKAEIMTITVWSQPRQIVPETLSGKTLHKNRAGGVAQGEEPQYCKKREKMIKE